jgi:hypothetical protein
MAGAAAGTVRQDGNESSAEVDPADELSGGSHDDSRWARWRRWWRGLGALWAERSLRGLTSFLISFVFHLLLLLLLAFLLIPSWPQARVELTVGTASSVSGALERLEPVLELESLPDSELIEVVRDDLRGPVVPELPIVGGIPVAESAATQSSWLEGLRGERLLEPTHLPVGGGWEGRELAGRRERALRYGGTEASENAVELGLAWLAAHQRPDGSWRFNHHDGPCGGSCRNPGSASTTTGATGLALLTYLGAGYTSEQGKYQQVVRRGLYYLTSRMLVTEHGGDLQEGTMYGQGLATLALCEAFGMTGDPQLRPAAQDAVNFICYAQHPRGGWRYLPGQPGDTTVFGWQIMALKSATMAGLDVPSPVIELAMSYLDSVQSSQGATYGYQKPGHDPAPTAIGLLARMYHGWRSQDPRLDEGILFLDSIAPSKSDMYFNYYATQVLHHLGGPYWERWNERMRDYLVGTQATLGHERGSWHFSDQHGDVGGRLYTTAMCIMILEVYYRHMPLYDRRTIEEGW